MCGSDIRSARKEVADGKAKLRDRRKLAKFSSILRYSAVVTIFCSSVAVGVYEACLHFTSRHLSQPGLVTITIQARLDAVFEAVARCNYDKKGSVDTRFSSHTDTAQSIDCEPALSAL